MLVQMWLVSWGQLARNDLRGAAACWQMCLQTLPTIHWPEISTKYPTTPTLSLQEKISPKRSRGPKESSRSRYRSALASALPSPCVCVFTSQAWTTARCWSRWSGATGCRAPRTAPSHCTSWCCSAGRRTPRSGPPSSTCKPSLKTTSRPQSLSTSPGTTSRPLPHLGLGPGLAESALLQNSGAFPARSFFSPFLGGSVQLPPT